MENNEMPVQKIKNGTVTIVGGWFLREYIQQFLGKDWFQSLTVWGLIVIAAANAGIDAACQLEIMYIDDCAWAASFFDKIGRVLVVLGIRRRVQA
jgi:hypothetical protein